MNAITFTPTQVRALCGGEFPSSDGFEWSRVEHFKLEDGVLQPYSSESILPGPAIAVSTYNPATQQPLTLEEIQGV